MSERPLDRGLPLLDRYAHRARFALYAYMGVLPFSTLETAAEWAGWVDAENGGSDPWSTVALAILIVTFVVMIVTMILVAMWIYRAHAHLKFTRAQGPTMDPSWAIGWYFIPIANLVKPFDAMRQLWTRSGTREVTDGRTSILKFWWGAWILANIFSNASVLPSSSPAIMQIAPALDDQ
jgi:hypothetical protein